MRSLWPKFRVSKKAVQLLRESKAENDPIKSYRKYQKFERELKRRQ